MKRTRIKLCGIRDAATARAAADAGADAVGLGFAEGSRRLVTIEEAKRVVEALPAFVEAVGLFVDAPAGVIRKTAEAVGLATVQLHGDEPTSDVAALRPLRVIKAIAFDASSADEVVGRWRDAGVAGLLVDAPKGAGSGPAGGSGRTMDWQALAEFRRDGRWPDDVPMILAGGLTPENVGSAIEAVRPYAVDVSSGIESRPGEKDVAKIAAFCEAVRQCDTQ